MNMLSTIRDFVIFASTIILVIFAYNRFEAVKLQAARIDAKNILIRKEIEQTNREIEQLRKNNKNWDSEILELCAKKKYLFCKQHLQ